MTSVDYPRVARWGSLYAAQWRAKSMWKWKRLVIAYGLGNPLLYFAYGMNTNPRGMAQRCPGALSMGPARLIDRSFRFSTHADVVKVLILHALGTHLNNIDKIQISNASVSVVDIKGRDFRVVKVNDTSSNLNELLT